VSADLRAWTETPGGRLRAALGITDHDVTLRARELLEAEEITRRSIYGTAPPPRQWAYEAGLAAAAAEGQQVAFTSSYAIAEAWNSRDPLNRMGVQAEEGSRGFAMAVRSGDGRITYQGDPAAVERLQQSVADAGRRQAEAARMDRQAMGPFYGTVA